MHERQALDDEVVPVLALALERVVDVAERDGEEDGRVLAVERVRAEEVVEGRVEAVAGVEDVAVEDEEGHVEFLGGNGFAELIPRGEGGALLVDGLAGVSDGFGTGGIFGDRVVHGFDLAEHELHVWGGVEDGFVWIAAEAAEHGEEAVGIGDELVFFDEPTRFVCEGLLVL